MTVDVRTGEVVAHMSSASARKLTDEIREALTVAYDRLIEAWHGRADLALGYESWDAYCACEFTEARMVRPGHEQRREIVASMRSEGMSTRAIGSAIGISHEQVRQDAASVKNLTDDEIVQPQTVTSLDGRQRPASQPPRTRPEPDVIEAEIVDEPLPQLPTGERERFEEDLRRESVLRAARTNLRSVLIYTTSAVLEPSELAADYSDVLDDFKQDDLDYAAQTVTAIAALKRGEP